MSAIGVKIADTARKHVDSTDWAYDKAKGDFGKNTNKCNLFVYDVAVEAGCKPAPSVPKYLVFSRPPLAREWADPDTDISGWITVTSPEPGDVAAIAKEYSDATGHVAIVIRSGQTASATSDKVVLNDWGFRAGQSPTFKRFTGTG